MKHNYAEFDKSLLMLIVAGRNTMVMLDSVQSGLHRLAEPFCTTDRWGNKTPHFRIIDRRLQALRKKGEIRFNGKIWERVITS